MRTGSIYFATLALCACNSHEAVTIPVDQTTGFRDGYRVEITRSGSIEWNGQKLNDAEFVFYMREYAGKQKEAGRLWVEFEPGVPANRASEIRQQVIASGLCKQKRCVEGHWGVQRPVVN
jgi:hypothetical protein